MAHAFMCFFGPTMGPIIYISVATPTFYDGLAVTLPPPPPTIITTLSHVIS